MPAKELFVLEMISEFSQENPVHNAGRARRIPHARVNGLSLFLARQLICQVQSLFSWLIAPRCLLSLNNF